MFQIHGSFKKRLPRESQRGSLFCDVDLRFQADGIRTSGADLLRAKAPNLQASNS
jgi:hypothetical protein